MNKYKFLSIHDTYKNWVGNNTVFKAQVSCEIGLAISFHLLRHDQECVGNSSGARSIQRGLNRPGFTHNMAVWVLSCVEYSINGWKSWVRTAVYIITVSIIPLAAFMIAPKVVMKKSVVVHTRCNLLRKTLLCFERK